jgi:hypothetical protein
MCLTIKGRNHHEKHEPVIPAKKTVFWPLELEDVYPIFSVSRNLYDGLRENHFRVFELAPRTGANPIVLSVFFEGAVLAGDLNIYITLSQNFNLLIALHTSQYKL